jgi:hypothetical protein
MKESTWMKYLTGELKASSLSPAQRAQILRRIRDKADECIGLLITISNNLGNVTDKPDKQFNQIFNNEKALLFFKSTQLAWDKGRRYEIERLSQEWLKSEQMAIFLDRLKDARIDYDPVKIFEDKEYRRKIQVELLKYSSKRYFGT